MLSRDNARVDDGVAVRGAKTRNERTASASRVYRMSALRDKGNLHSSVICSTQAARFIDCFVRVYTVHQSHSWFRMTDEKVSGRLIQIYGRPSYDSPDISANNMS